MNEEIIIRKEFYADRFIGYPYFRLIYYRVLISIAREIPNLYLPFQRK